MQIYQALKCIKVHVIHEHDAYATYIHAEQNAWLYHVYVKCKCSMFYKAIHAQFQNGVWNHTHFLLKF